MEGLPALYHHSGGRLGREGVGVVYNRCGPTFAVLVPLILVDNME